MAELACLTGRAGGAKEVLPALEYLAHPVATLPLDEASLQAAVERWWSPLAGRRASAGL